MRSKKMAHPSTEKRGGNPDLKKQPAQKTEGGSAEKKLEQGLEESMAGSDPVSITQPSPSKINERR
jgi:hypothetical protein